MHFLIRTKHAFKQNLDNATSFDTEVQIKLNIAMASSVRPGVFWRLGVLITPQGVR